MSKPTKITTAKQPKFAPGTQVVSPVLIVDDNGVAWWVDPHARTVTRV